MMFHTKTIKEIFEELKTSENGLSQTEVERRLKLYGKNELKETRKISPVKIFFSQFKSFIIGILIFATIIAAILGEWVDASVIGAILILNAVLGFIQEYRAEKAIEALKKLAAPKAKVLRDGKIFTIHSSEVVPGDILIIETGDKIAADARLIELSNLETQEASLTGESTPVRKELTVLPKDTAVADMKNMVFSSTIVTKGRAKAVVVSTGMNTEMGKIAKLVGESKRESTPLQKKLGSLGRFIGYIVIAIAIIIFATGIILKGTSFTETLLMSVSLAVAAVPEGLPAVVTISLAIGIQRMAKKNALIRWLPSVETLGSVNVICTDKTGTLTKNEMTVTKIFANNSAIDISGEGYSTKGIFSSNGKEIDAKRIEILLKAGVLCNDSSLKPQLIGDPTEIALLVSAEKAGINSAELRSKIKRIDEIPFDSERKMMSTLNYDGKNFFVFTKGAVENVLDSCSRILENGKVRRISKKDKDKIIETNKKFAESALRVLAFAYKPSKNEKINEKNLIFLGLQAMIDPPRIDAIEAMRKCESAGIRVIMITGDHEITAKAIGKIFGLKGRVMNGSELEKISQEELRKIVNEISIFARVNPYHKLKIVNALKENGHIVAMTGDGVNDAPALKKADIGIAMGITGTDVAKEASDMILVDDNFASIVNAVEEGRGVYDNIRKFFAFLLSGNIGEVLIIFFSMIIFLKIPLTAIQILMVNLFTDGLPAVALGFDSFEPDVMKQKPRSAREKIYHGLNAFIVWYPLIMTCAALLIFWWFSSKSQLVKAQTALFLTVVMFELYQAFSCRSVKHPVFKVGIFKNKLLLAAVAISLVVTFSVIYVPLLNPIFHTTALNLGEALTIVFVSMSGAAFIEISKAVKNRKKQ